MAGFEVGKADIMSTSSSLLKASKEASCSTERLKEVLRFETSKEASLSTEIFIVLFGIDLAKSNPTLIMRCNAPIYSNSVRLVLICNVVIIRGEWYFRIAPRKTRLPLKDPATTLSSAKCEFKNKREYSAALFFMINRAFSGGN